MARPKKDGLDYFPLDTDFFGDRKIQILNARYGPSGVCVYTYLLCEIYKKGYYLKYDEDMEYLITQQFGLANGLIKQVLKFLCERSLLDSTLFTSDTILTSPGIQKRYQEAVKTRALKTPIIVRDYWLLKKEETASYIKVTPKGSYSEKNPSYSEKNPSYSEKNPYKVKKSKVKYKERVENKFSQPTPEEVEQYIKDNKLNVNATRFADYYNSNGWHIGKVKMQDWKAAVQNWSRTEYKNSSNTFNNLDSRDIDYMELEKKILGRGQDGL